MRRLSFIIIILISFYNLFSESSIQSNSQISIRKDQENVDDQIRDFQDTLQTENSSFSYVEWEKKQDDTSKLNWKPSRWKWNPQSLSLLDPNSYEMNHSITSLVGYSGGQSLYENTYTNHITYNLSENFKMKLDLHFTNFGTAKINNNFNIESNGDNSSEVIPDFSMEYKPSKNTRIIFQYRGATNSPTVRRNYWWRY